MEEGKFLHGTSWHEYKLDPGKSRDLRLLDPCENSSSTTRPTKKLGIMTRPLWQHEYMSFSTIIVGKDFVTVFPQDKIG